MKKAFLTALAGLCLLQAGLPSPGPTGFASTAKGGGEAGAGLPSPGPSKAGAGVCSGLILSGAFTPIYKSGFGAVERINPLIVRERHSLQIGFDEPPALGNADELVTPTYLHLFIKYVYMSSNVRSLLI